MRKTMLYFMSCFIVLTVVVNKSIAQTLIYYWHFNTTLPVDGSGGINYGPNPIYSDYSANSEKAYVVYKPIDSSSADTGSVDNCSGKSKNDRIGFGGCCGAIDNGIRLRNPSDNMQFLWVIPTGNLKNIMIMFATESSSFTHGQLEQDYSYSTDGGNNFVTTGLQATSYTPDTTWKKLVLDLSAVSAVNDNESLVFRITYKGQTTGSKGNNRFDNITVEGDYINPVTVQNTLNTNYKLFPNPAQNIINIVSSSELARNIEVYNSLGIQVMSFSTADNSIPVNISHLKAGFYYVNILDKIHGKTVKLNFIKE
jgi:hypothetical protein